MLMRQKWYPRPHNHEMSIHFGLEKANYSTFFPIAHYDEGLGAADAYESNPQHASFAEYSGSSCYPESHINSIMAKLRFTMTKGLLTTDGIHAVKVDFMPIFMSFLEDYTPIDEKSTDTVEDVLKLQHETTDRQGGGLYNGTDMEIPFAGASDLGTATPFLTVDLKAEETDFSLGKYFDAIHYYTIAGKIKAVQGGLNSIILTKTRPTVEVNIKMRNKIKAVNPYMLFGVMVQMIFDDNAHQLVTSDECTDLDHVYVNFRYRFNEWNGAFRTEPI